MDTNQQETLLQTVRANLERNEKGEMKAIFDNNGKWNIVFPSKVKLTKEFRSVTFLEIDPLPEFLKP